ncbi:hypothetical protein L1987_62552 [Smallanthus sonchifolius]|uniref:Uncharacterized protein n=1 Tax=Smallanthus sonchifolius TaxID=185202 RepID=A0ACB9CAS9_9ASTR|nr:hypothetical protein L1987_62552 [Smallanthus sonchifolius]
MREAQKAKPLMLWQRLGFSCYRRERRRSQGADHYSSINAVYSHRLVSGAPYSPQRFSFDDSLFLIAAESSASCLSYLVGRVDIDLDNHNLYYHRN